ncbi:hypothetical protein HY490_03155 [Candidatus Woesearchaeota archaeon]|nr:hypothetical protein [Candidatus Woesearchaeota archaeon]
MVVVSERSIERLLIDVAPKVERLTGWKTHLDALTVKLVRRDQVWEHGIKPKYNILGIDTEAKTEKGKKDLGMIKVLMPYVLGGLYEPLTGTMLIVPDNVRFGTNESGLTVTLGHELVHRCQFTNHPRWAEMYPTLVRKITGSSAFDDDEHEDKSYMKYLQAYMTLAEGDASHVETQLKKMFYQDAKNKTAHVSNFIGLLLFLHSLGNAEDGFIKKLKQYEQGERIVGRVYETEGRKGVNELYNLDAGGLYQKFG